MVGLVAKTDFRIAKFPFFNHFMTISSFFFYLEKVRYFSSQSGRPAALSARLKLQSGITWSNFGNFADLKSPSTTNSHILNKMAPSKTREKIFEKIIIVF